MLINFLLNSNKMFFYFILIFSTMISISSNSWLGCWIGLEINLLSFIPLISNSNNLLASEASLKYFLTQSIASMNFLFIIMLMMFFMKNFYNNILYSSILNLPLLMKMGAAPFHFWFPNIIEGLSWLNCFLILTWQKISPMILISYFTNMKFMFFIMIINSIIGALGGLNQMSLRKILTFSSINNMGWMLAAMMISENIWLLYFSIYFFLNMTLCLIFYFFNIIYFNQLFFSNLKNIIKICLFINLLSLGGLPPFLGFFIKWMLINFLIFNKMFILNFIFIMMSLVTLFFYIRITYSSLMFNYLKMKWFKFKMKNFHFYYCYFMSMISIMGLPMSTFYLYFF
uniref:NADH dehydrogenase subunit 2 n=1 Tax=Atteva charopis TaxID=1371471 RepID=UPI0024115FD3|nr:NADH dehydrogenase subunit 2 [Atteva charopis]WEG93565.1 NADH dehydrogenase subunit 2 [Atteva charopis]